MKNIFDNYFEGQDEKTYKNVKDICDFVNNNFIQRQYKIDEIKFKKQIIRESILNLIVKCITIKDISITNTELSLIMSELKKIYNF